MSNDLVTITPEGLEIAQTYLALGSAAEAANELGISLYQVTQWLNKPEVKRFIDNVYLDTGYRNKNLLGSALDEIIASKLEESQETGMYTKKDLVDLLELAHKMRMDELKLQQSSTSSMNVKTQNNVQINGGGNLGALVEKLAMADKSD
jgi:hypothetical protein